MSSHVCGMSAKGIESCEFPAFGVPGQIWTCDCGKEFTAQLMEEAVSLTDSPPGDYVAASIVWFGSELLAALKETRREKRRVHATGGEDSPKILEVE